MDSYISANPIEKQIEKKKLLHLEFMRIIAIFFVMFNHTGNNGFFYFSIVNAPVKQWIYLFISIFCKFAVPLFFMISGSLLLGKTESVGEVFKKRILKYAFVLIIISLFYWLYYGKSLSLPDFFKTLYSRNWAVALWYLYTYLGIMLMLPLLQKMVKNLSNFDYVYLAGVSLVFVGVIPIIEYSLFQGKLTLNHNIKPVMFTATNIVYFIMGYYFEHVMPKKYLNMKVLLYGIVLSIISILICSEMTIYRGHIMKVLSEGKSQAFHNSLIAILTYTIFLGCKMIFENVKLSKHIEQLIITVGGTTFGIYLLERFLRDETKFIFNYLKPYCKTMLACFIWIFCALVFGIIIVYFLKKFRLIRKFI